MKIEEIKMRMHKFVNNMIDLYMPPTNFLDKMKNATAKLWIDQNIWQIDAMLDSFGDKDHQIDVDKIMEYYEDVLFEDGDLRLDIKSMIPDDYEWMKNQLPNKIILFKKEDLHNIFHPHTTVAPINDHMTYK